MALFSDGVVPAGEDDGFYAIDRYDMYFNDLAVDIMQRCDDDPVCSDRMETYGTGSLDVLAKTFANVDSSGLCSELNPLIDRTALHQMLADLAKNWWGRMVLPALLYRINRCNAGDVEIIEALFSHDDSEAEESEFPTFNYNLNTNIITSELIGGTSLDEAQAFSDLSYASPDETLSQFIARDVTGWPVYALDEITHQWPETDMPVLIMNGDMDPQTPVEGAQFAKVHYTGANQYLVVFPTAVHGILPLTLMPGIDINALAHMRHAGLFDFLNNPTPRRIHPARRR